MLTSMTSTISHMLTSMSSSCQPSSMPSISRPIRGTSRSSQAPLCSMQCTHRRTTISPQGVMHSSKPCRGSTSHQMVPSLGSSLQRNIMHQALRATQGNRCTTSHQVLQHSTCSSSSSSSLQGLHSSTSQEVLSMRLHSHQVQHRQRLYPRPLHFRCATLLFLLLATCGQAHCIQSSSVPLNLLA